MKFGKGTPARWRYDECSAQLVTINGGNQIRRPYLRKGFANKILNMKHLQGVFKNGLPLCCDISENPRTLNVLHSRRQRMLSVPPCRVKSPTRRRYFGSVKMR